ncbi:MAG: hypothetical protein IH874_08575 [Candidatus Dadabacteria bacterium]|nr:hypothetical protein [Candidatus Dadabacteria bacterium]
MLTLTAVLIGCGGKELPPGHDIAGIRAPIHKILLSPLAYDGAIVVVEGIVKHPEQEIDEETQKSKESKISFKLYDLSGLYINVTLQGPFPVEENSFVVLGGIYRRASNEIEAHTVRIVSMGEEMEKMLEKKRKSR